MIMKNKEKRTSSAAVNPPEGGKLTHFEYVNRQAEAVYVAGTFNGWHPVVSEMLYRGNGKWVKDLALSPGQHEYLFVADGKWVPDPKCADSVPNPYGGRNSLCTVLSEKEAA